MPSTEGASRGGGSIKEGGAVARREKKSASSIDSRKVSCMTYYFTVSSRIVIDNDTTDNATHNTAIHNIRSLTGIGSPTGHSPRRETKPVANTELGCHL